MKIEKLINMKNGWFIGNFVPTVHKTSECEVAIKKYKKGETERKHYHKVATEYTVVISGKIKMFDTVYSEGDIVIAEPGDITGFESIDDSINVVVKIPSLIGDKYGWEE